jgi:ribonucleoside-diphosphate reductase alpha chain
MSTTEYGVSNLIWEMRYKTTLEDTVEAMMVRVARALASVESDPRRWEAAFTELLLAERFVPAGRILINAGAPSPRACLPNTYVAPMLDDSVDGIWGGLRMAALTLQSGGGLGQDFSNIRERGAPIRGGVGTAAGPVGLLNVWDETCRYIQRGGAKRGAMLASLSIHHPDVLEFIHAKRELMGHLQFFNLSLMVSERFTEALRDGGQSPLFDPADPGRQVGEVDATELWEAIRSQVFATGEPGLLFPNRANRLNNLSYCEQLLVTGSCGEQWLPAFGSGTFASLNLPLYVVDPLTPRAHLDFELLERDLRLGLRLMDNALTITPTPLPQHRAEIDRTRRLGIGVFGLGTMLALLEQPYGGEESLASCRRLMTRIANVLYRASSELAGERGPFPAFEQSRYLAAPFVSSLDEETRASIARHGMRNSHLMSCQPTGLASAIFGNMSSGIEPIPGLAYKRLLRVREHPTIEYEEIECEDYACRLAQELRGPDAFATTKISTLETVRLVDQLSVFSTMAEHVDAAIAKTVNFAPRDTSLEELDAVMRAVMDSPHIKGVTFSPLDSPARA